MKIKLVDMESKELSFVEWEDLGFEDWDNWEDFIKDICKNYGNYKVEDFERILYVSEDGDTYLELIGGDFIGIDWGIRIYLESIERDEFIKDYYNMEFDC